MSCLSGKKALITGGAKRLGLACAKALAESGADIVLHYNSSESDALEASREISAIGAKVWTLQQDLSGADSAGELVHKALEIAGGLDILINNASTFPAASIESLEYDQLADSIRINSWAPFSIGREMHKLGLSGHIVNFLDCRIESYDWSHVGYHAAKVLLELFTREMAIKFAPNIAVNAVAPGLILPPEGKTAQYLESLVHTVPMLKHGGPSDITNAVLYLVQTDFVTGQVIFTDGGRHLLGANCG